MKRFITLLLAAISLLTLSLMPISCGPAGTEQNGTQPNVTTAAPQDTECVHQYTAVETPATYTEKGFTTHTCEKCGDTYVDSYVDALASVILQYDDYVTTLGNIQATSTTATISGDSLEVITKDGTTYFHAKNVGVVTVTDGDKTETVAIDKARLHLVVVMGQSNAGCHFANAMSDVACDIGTAYWWPTYTSNKVVDYTRTSTGFHAPLVAELRAQSVAAGSPEKPVLIWLEGATSKDGQAITAWAASATDTSGTDTTVKMIEDCIKYYTAAERADKYEIVESGVYWLQGEGGSYGDPAIYVDRFMAMWNRLKDAGMNYLAFLRVRKGVSFNSTVTDHNDLMHHGALRAQMEMINENDDMYLASTITENWIGQVNDKHSINISNYITMMEAYGKSENYSDKLGNKATFKDGILTTTMKELYGENNKCHYGKFGYGIIGADAAYNMYRALHKDEFAIVYTDTSGMVDKQVTSKAGETVQLDITGMTEMLTFRPACYSTAGTLEITVKKGNTTITNVSGVLSKAENTYMAISTEKIRTYDDVTITVTYTTTDGESGSVVYEIVNN